MSDQPSERDALFVKLGEYFQAGATGPLAICALVVIALAVIAAKAMGAL